MLKETIDPEGMKPHVMLLSQLTEH